MNAHRFHGGVERLRSPERVALLEVARVVELCLARIAAQSMLDVGTGSAVFAQAFAAQGLAVTGIDVNPEMVEAAGRYVPQGRFELAPVEAIPFPDASFDLVFMGHVLHEADDPLQALREVRRVARMRVAVLEWPHQEGTHGPPLAHRLKPEQVAELAQEAGFGNVETLPLTHTVLYRLSV